MRQKYAISENSKESFYRLQNSGKSQAYKTRIINALSVRPMTRAELVKICRAKHPSNLTYPLKALENEGFIIKAGKQYDPRTDREVTFYALVASANPLYINRDLSTDSLHLLDSDSSKKAEI